MQETNEYVDLKDQEAAQPKETGKHTELQTTTSEEVRLQSLDTNEVQSIISFLLNRKRKQAKALV